MLSKQCYCEKVDEDLEPIIPDFIQNTKDEIASMRKALDADDFAALRRMGHGTKGAALGYGLKIMAEMGREIQSLAEKRQVKELNEAVDKLEDYILNMQIEFIEIDEDDDEDQE